MGWFGFGGRKSASEGSPQTVGSTGDSSTSAGAVGVMPEHGGGSEAADVAAVDHGTAVSFQTAADGAAVSFSPPPPPPALEDVAREAEESGAGAGPGGYVGRLRTAVLDCVDTAKRAPETFEEALAVMKGERAVKPDYGRAVSTVSAAFAGGCAHGWWHGASLAAKFPPHQRSIVRVRAGASRGLRFATFALIFESSSAVMEALRRKKDFVGGTVGGALAGMAYGVSGGVAAARSGLFYGVWLGGMFGLFRNHVADLKEQARMAEEDERLAQEERDAIGRSALMRSIAGLDAQLASWPTATDAEPEEEEGADPDKLSSLQRK